MKRLAPALMLAACTDVVTIDLNTDEGRADCAEKMMNITIDAQKAQIKSTPSDRPDYNPGNDEFDEMWLGGYHDKIAAIASIPVLEDGEYKIYDAHEVDIYPDTDAADFADGDIDYETGNFLTSVDFSQETGLDQTWVNMAITDVSCDTLRGWGEFYFEGDRDDYNVTLTDSL